MKNPLKKIQIPKEAEALLRAQEIYIEKERLNEKIYIYDAFDETTGTGYIWQEDFFNTILNDTSGNKEYNISLKPTTTLPFYTVNGMWNGSDIVAEGNQSDLVAVMLSKERKKFLIPKDITIDRRLRFFTTEDLYAMGEFTNEPIKDIKIYVMDFNQDHKTAKKHEYTNIRLREIVSFQIHRQNATDSGKIDYIKFNFFRVPIQPINVKTLKVKFKSKPLIQRIYVFQANEKKDYVIDFKSENNNKTIWSFQPFIRKLNGNSVVFQPTYSNELNYIKGLLTHSASDSYPENQQYPLYIYRATGLEQYWVLSEPDGDIVQGATGLIHGLKNIKYWVFHQNFGASGTNNDNLFNEEARVIGWGLLPNGLSITGGIGAEATTGHDNLSELPSFSNRDGRFFKRITDQLYLWDAVYYTYSVGAFGENWNAISTPILNTFDNRNIYSDGGDGYVFTNKYYEDMSNLLQGKMVWRGHSFNIEPEGILVDSQMGDYNKPFLWEVDKLKKAMSIYPQSIEDIDANAIQKLNENYTRHTYGQAFGQTYGINIIDPSYSHTKELNQDFFIDEGKEIVLYLEFLSVISVISKLQLFLFGGFEIEIEFFDENGEHPKIIIGEGVNAREIEIGAQVYKASNRKGNPLSNVLDITYGTGETK